MEQVTLIAKFHVPLWEKKETELYLNMHSFPAKFTLFYANHNVASSLLQEKAIEMFFFILLYCIRVNKKDEVRSSSFVCI